ncbi:MAG TPA: type II CAAX endopeptidase family protein [Rhodanobacteraceae bacterium]
MDFPDDTSVSVIAHAVPPARLPGPWTGLATVILYFVLQLVVSVVLGAMLAFGYGVMQGLHGHKVGSAAMLHLMRSPDITTGMTVAVMAVAAAISLWLIRVVWPTMWRLADPPGFGFVVPREWIGFVYAVILGVAVAVIGGMLTHLLAQGHVVHQDVTVMGRHVSSGKRLALAALVVCVVPVVEELIFRGVLLSGLMRRLHVGWAVAISAVIFGCAHLPDFGFAWYAIPTLVILGLVLAWLRLRSRSLWPSIVMHATNNLIATIGWFVATRPHG